MDGAKTAAFDFGPTSGHPDSAVLLLHGFTGSPWEVRPLADSLAARGYRVSAPLLPGHGGDGDAMAFVTWRDWENAALAALEALSAFRTVHVAGLSMGALLAVLLAARRPSSVTSLALLAPAYRLRPFSGRAFRALRMVPDRFMPDHWVTKAGSDLHEPEARRDNPVMKRFPLVRLRDLFMLQDLVRMAAPQVKAKALLMVSRQDHTIDPDGVRTLHRALRGSSLVTLQRGFHIVTRDTDRARVATEVGAFFDRVTEVSGSSNTGRTTG